MKSSLIAGNSKLSRTEIATFARSYGFDVKENLSDDAAFWHMMADNCYWIATKCEDRGYRVLGQVITEALRAGATVAMDGKRCLINTSFGTSQYDDDNGYIDIAIKRWDRFVR